jgi:acyl carrier protein
VTGGDGYAQPTADVALRWLPELRRIIGTVMAVPTDSIEAHTVPNDVPAWDSLSHLTLVIALEEELGIRFSTAEIGGMTSVGAICAIVGRKRDA